MWLSTGRARASWLPDPGQARPDPDPDLLTSQDPGSTQADQSQNKTGYDRSRPNQDQDQSKPDQGQNKAGRDQNKPGQS